MTQQPNQSPANNTEAIPLALTLLLPLLAALVAVIPLAIDTYLPAMPAIAADFGADMSIVQLSLSVYLAGYALGLMVFGPMADIFGRRPLVLMGLTGFVILSLSLAMTDDAVTFVLLRALQAFIGSAATVTVSGYMKASYGSQLAKGLSYLTMIMLIAPMVAPSIGSLLLLIGDWRWIFVFLAAYAAVLLLLMVPILPKPVIQPRKASLFNTFFKSYVIVLSNRATHKYILMVCLTALIFFGYITSVSFVYLSVYQLSEHQFSLLFGSMVFVLMGTSFANGRLVGRWGSLTLIKVGWVLLVLGSVSLWLVNWQSLPLAWTVGAIAILLSGNGLLATNCDSLILLAFSEQTGTATGVIGTLRFGFGSLAGPLLALFADGSVMPFCYLMLLAVAATSVCLFFIPTGQPSQST